MGKKNVFDPLREHGFKKLDRKVVFFERDPSMERIVMDTAGRAVAVLMLLQPAPQCPAPWFPDRIPP